MSRLIGWRGPSLVAKYLEAAKGAIDETTEAAAEAARDSHWWRARHRRGHLESQIVHEPAEVQGARVTGKFGTTQRRGFYGLFHEVDEPFLRPAADKEFPKLAERIKERM